MTFSIKIPSFSKTAIGSSATSATPFYENGMVVGLETKIFSLADNVVLGIDPKFDTMVAIPDDYEFSIHTTDGSKTYLTGATDPSKTLNQVNAISTLPYWTKTEGGKTTKYYLIGKAGYKFRTSPGAYTAHAQATCKNYSVTVLGVDKVVAMECTYNGSDTSEISLFNGSELQKIVASKVSDNKTQDVTLAVK